MKLLENLVGKVKPHFEEGGKLENYYYGFEALETFLFVPAQTSQGTHIKDGIDLKRTMFTVVVAMIPALLFGIWNVGQQHFVAMGELTALSEGFMDKFMYGSLKVLPIVITAYGVGLGIE